MIDIPTAAFDALKAGEPPVTLFTLTLGATTWRYTDAPDIFVYEANTFNTGTPLLEIRNVGSAPQNGTIELVLGDIARSWAQRFEVAGPRGNAVELRSVLPYGTDQTFLLSAFIGRTLRVAPIRPQGGGSVGYRLGVECADAAAVPLGMKAEWTTDAYQSKLAAELGLSDDSHSEANKARQLVWHRA